MYRKKKEKNVFVILIAQLGRRFSNLFFFSNNNTIPILIFVKNFMNYYMK